VKVSPETNLDFPVLTKFCTGTFLSMRLKTTFFFTKGNVVIARLVLNCYYISCKSKFIQSQVEETMRRMKLCLRVLEQACWLDESLWLAKRSKPMNWLFPEFQTHLSQNELYLYFAYWLDGSMRKNMWNQQHKHGNMFVCPDGFELRQLSWNKSLCPAMQ